MSEYKTTIISAVRDFLPHTQWEWWYAQLKAESIAQLPNVTGKYAKETINYVKWVEDYYLELVK